MDTQTPATRPLDAYAGQTVVVKLGGAAMDDAAFLDRVAASVAALLDAGAFPVLVHGGGPDINRHAERLGLAPRFVKGRRVTDEATLRAVTMVLCGDTNKRVVGALAARGVDALGLSGLDANLLVARPTEEELGLVGVVAEVNVPLLQMLTGHGYVPVVAPVSRFADGRPCNVNADEAASAIALALGAKAFVLLTDVEGLYARFPDPASLLARVTTHEAERLVHGGAAGQGMVPKVTAAVQAADGGVAVVVMTGGAADGAVEAALRGERGTRVAKP